MSDTTSTTTVPVGAERGKPLEVLDASDRNCACGCSCDAGDKGEATSCC